MCKDVNVGSILIGVEFLYDHAMKLHRILSYLINRRDIHSLTLAFPMSPMIHSVKVKPEFTELSADVGKPRTIIRKAMHKEHDALGWFIVLVSMRIPITFQLNPHIIFFVHHIHVYRILNWKSESLEVDDLWISRFLIEVIYELPSVFIPGMTLIVSHICIFI